MKTLIRLFEVGEERCFREFEYDYIVPIPRRGEIIYGGTHHDDGDWSVKQVSYCYGEPVGKNKDTLMIDIKVEFLPFEWGDCE